ncbi:hypothetical protein GCM10022287_02380 [Gryllotalpicola koreensis]|uniref:Uncharacterized protein n=1 Tax=Gryllotalpicola koreensis TaxID=993086 RepID=A0ABP7ZQF4_9MICO
MRGAAEAEPERRVVAANHEVVEAFLSAAQGAAAVLVAGEPSVAWMVNGRPRVVFLFQMAGGRVQAIDLVADRDAVAAMRIVPLTGEE